MLYILRYGKGAYTAASPLGVVGWNHDRLCRFL